MINQKSIAVLPFDNLSSDPENEYFSDGMTEEIINALSKVEGLQVTARTSSFLFKNKKEDVRHIGNKLGVSTVLEGSIRKSGDRVRITSQLIRTDNGFHIWSENFDRNLTDIFELQDEISLLIAEKIRETFGHLEINEHLVSPSTQNIKAYELFLKGTYHFKRKDFDDIQLALKLFEEAVTLDPNYAEAYAYMGETYIHMSGFNLLTPEEGFKNARKSAEKAIEINKEEARAYKVIANVDLFYDWKWDESIAAYNMAIKYGITSDNDFISYYYIFIQKDYELAISIAKETVSKDPLHAITHWQLGLCYYFAQQFEPALEAFKASIRLDENFAESMRWAGLVYACLGDFENAFDYVDMALNKMQGQGLANIDRLSIRILSGEKENVIEDIENLNTPDPCDKAQLYSLLKMPEKAVPLLKKGFETRSTMLVTLKHYWIWDNIREDLGFKEVVKAMNFGDQKTHKPHQQTSQLVPVNNYGLTEGDIEQIMTALNEAMNHEELVTDHQLSLRKLAELINLHPNKLSWVLNDQMGKNFNEFINEHRLTLFQHKAKDPANSHFSILGLAYESGFSSKSVFNDFFKKKMGTTPKVWMKQ